MAVTLDCIWTHFLTITNYMFYSFANKTNCEADKTFFLSNIFVETVSENYNFDERGIHRVQWKTFCNEKAFLSNKSWVCVSVETRAKTFIAT